MRDGGNGHAPEYGGLVERAVCDEYGLDFVGESWYDATSEEHPYAEIKGAQKWTRNGYDQQGNPTRTRGQWKVWQDSHQKLREAHGVYILALYDEDGNDDIDLLESRVVEPRALDEVIGDDWWDVRSNPRTGAKGSVYRINWARVFDPEAV